MKMKRILALTLALVLCLGLLASCGKKKEPAASGTIKVAAIATAYMDKDPEMWKKVCDAFTKQTGIKVELVTDKKLEDVIGPSMQGGDYPDVVHLATGREAGLTEQFINNKNLTDITDVMNMTIPGETGKVIDKILPNFVSDNNAGINPYGDGKTYLAPMFYSPCGLFYNAGLFEAKGWTVPTTWDEMWALGDKAKAEGIYLFTYPTAGYFDAFLYALMYSVGGAEFFHDATHYVEGVWDTDNGKAVFSILEKLASYTDPVTPSQANQQDFTQNQLLVMQNKALFMPNGTWIVGEMADAQAAEGFKWGMTALPAFTSGGAGYSYTFFEQAWIPAEAKNVDAAKQFIAFLYSDVAVDIFASAGAVQPVAGVVKKLSGDNVIFYSIYENGANPALGSFAPYEAIPGMDNTSVFFEPINSLVSGSLTAEQWRQNVITATDKMRENLK